MTVKRGLISLFVLLIGIGIFFRFYQITQSQFVYYDEGMWLNQDRGFVTLVSQNPPKSLSEFFKIINISAHLSLATAKSLWTFISHLRAFLVGVDGWYFTRVVSALFGSLTLGVTYCFARRYYGLRWAGFLAMAILAILPSHVYYSRLALQEALSTFCFVTGLYWYLFPRKLHAKTFFSAGLLSFTFFSNYRMIIAPLLVGFCAVWEAVSRREKFAFQKYLWHTLTFAAIVFGVGSLDRGANTHITFAWMFHQANLAQGHFEWVNLLSYPYYLFRLESTFFGLFFFGNIYFIMRRQWDKLLPFAVVCFMMGLFSLSQEKGVRYLCAVMPLMVMAVAGLIVTLWQNHKNEMFRRGLMLAVMVMIGIQCFKGNVIAHFSSDYKSSIQDILEKDPDAKVLSTQSMVQKLYVDQEENIASVPHRLQSLITYYLQGYRYLIIDPQAYVSYTADKKRFTSRLKGYLEFITQKVPPLKTYSHFNPALLERFVLEHNESLSRSLDFLEKNKAITLAGTLSFVGATKGGELGQLKVYDIRQCLEALRRGGYQ